MDKMGVYNILLTPSSSIWKQSMIVMLSAILNCSRKCHFFVMQSDWTDEIKKEVVEFVSLYSGNEIKFIDVDDKQFSFVKPWKGHNNTYYKIIAHQFLPDGVDRFLYLDCDTLILKDIVKYYDMDFNGSHLIASVERLSEEQYKRENADGIEKHGSINGGVILFNCKKFREENITFDTYREVISKFKGEYFADQGLLSYMFKDSMIILPNYKYNHTLFLESGVGKKLSFKSVFEMKTEEKIKQLTEPYWNEEYDEEQDSTIVHFTGAYNPIIAFPVIKDGKMVFPYAPVTLAFNVDRRYIEPHWVTWWKLAQKLPVEVYHSLIEEAVDYIRNRLKQELTWMTNAEHFFETVAYDSFEKDRFYSFIMQIKNGGKTLSILKNSVAAGRFLSRIASDSGIEIVFSTPKGSLKELTDEEQSKCCKADVIINCDIHIGDADEYKGYRSIRIQDITNLENIVHLALGSANSEEIKIVSKQVEQTNLLITEKANQVAVLLDQCFEKINSLNEKNDKLNKQVSEYIDSEVSLKSFAEDLKIKNAALYEQNNSLTSDLTETSIKLASYKNQIKSLETECESLKDQIAEMKNSRSWRYTKIFRKK